MERSRRRLGRIAGSVSSLLVAGALVFAPAAAAHGRRARPSPTATIAAGTNYNLPATQSQESAAQKKEATKTAELEDKIGDAAIALGGGILAYGALTGPGEALAAPIGLGVVAFGAGLKIGAAVGKYLWGDPFKDRHFTRLAKPRKVNVPTIGGAGANAIDLAATRYLVQTLKLVELGQAYQTSINRALGAHAAHNKRWTVRQLHTAARYARLGADYFLSLRGLREQFVEALASLGYSTITIPTTTAGAATAALKAELSKLPTAFGKLLRSKPLRGHSLATLLGQGVGIPPSGEIVLSTALLSPTLDQAEDLLAGHLRTFALIVARVRPGHLPAGL